jgi:hypothetical protein
MSAARVHGSSREHDTHCTPDGVLPQNLSQCYKHSTLLESLNNRLVNLNSERQNLNF